MDSGTGEICESSTKFQQFDVVNDVATDHHYLKNNKSGKVKDSTSLHIMKEWKILRKNLPESIYVRVYEPRLDLVRAVIIGPVGTPYHDGLFFFDIFLPLDYPNHPPKIYYHSYGYRLNPNLYASGYVCLSLINTWAGIGIEKWRKESTILQVLVSIQGLVLNERPYFNEPGYEVGKNSNSAKWINASNDYNENTFLLSCKTMLQVMRKPPQGFGDFVVSHFGERSVSLLDAVNVYQDGRVLLGQLMHVSASRKFKENLRKIRPELEKAFEKMSSGNENVDYKCEVRKEENMDDMKKMKLVGISEKLLEGKHGKDASSNQQTKKHVKKKGLWMKVFGGLKRILEIKG